MIQVLCDGRLFHLQTKGTSYVFFANPFNRLEHIYYGARVEDPTTMLMRNGRPSPASFSVMRQGEPSNMGPDVLQALLRLRKRIYSFLYVNFD